MRLLFMLQGRRARMEFWDHLFLFKRLYDQTMDPIAQQWDLTRMELDILLFLANAPAYDTAADIVERRRLTKSHVSVSIHSLIRRGWLERSYLPGNRKSAHLRPPPPSSPPLAARLREEAEWGVEVMLKNRYGDGYRASSMGLLIWQDGVFNTLDDISSVRVQNMAFDNFLYAGYEAYASMTLDNDPMQQEYLLRVAEEDFAFAMEKFKKDGFDQFVQPYEHSYNTSKSQYMATISWSASQLYKLTGKPSYADIAAEYIRYTLDCQRTEPLKDQDGTRGFFYRDKSRKSIVHYIHQSREQVYMQAMVMLCETQKEHPDYPKWVNSIQLYGEYLKGMMKYTHPYGMIPSGVYHAEEYKDTTNFYALHLFPPANAKELYTEQIKRGVQLDKEHYMKRFPVWFNIFNGNTAIHLSNGKSAAICGNFLKDKELLNIGLEQLYWTVGKNPFGQSLIYGEGHNYPQLNTFSSGEMTGEMPVGIRTLGNDDVPYWPQTNNACYKEVWVTSAGKWLSLTAEY